VGEIATELGEEAETEEGAQCGRWARAERFQSEIDEQQCSVLESMAGAGTPSGVCARTFVAMRYTAKQRQRRGP